MNGSDNPLNMCWNTARTKSLFELLQLQLHVYDVSTKLPGFDAVNCKMM